MEEGPGQMRLRARVRACIVPVEAYRGWNDNTRTPPRSLDNHEYIDIGLVHRSSVFGSLMEKDQVLRSGCTNMCVYIYIYVLS